MKRLLLLVAVFALLACNAAHAVNVVDGIKIDRASQPDTFLVSFLYNEWAGDEDSPLFMGYQIVISAEPIGWELPVNERAFTPGEILVGEGNGYLWLSGFDYTYSGPAPYQGIQIWAWGDAWNGDPYTIGEFPANTPLFSFQYTGSATEFVIYDEYMGQEAGRIAVPLVPEPSSLIALFCGSVSLFAFMRRRA